MTDLILAARRAWWRLRTAYLQAQIDETAARLRRLRVKQWHLENKEPSA